MKRRHYHVVDPFHNEMKNILRLKQNYINKASVISDYSKSPKNNQTVNIALHSARSCQEARQFRGIKDFK